MKHKFISHFDLEKVRMNIFRNYTTVDMKRSIINKDILNFFLGMNIEEILKYEPNQKKLGYDVWYE